MDCIENYDDNISLVEKPAALTSTIVAKPYTIEPNGLMTEDCRAILNEDSSQLLMQIG
jgi:hypothetical protein